MSQLIAMIVRIDDVNKPEELNEVWRQPLPQVTLEGLEAAHYLDGLEEQVREVGWALMRQLIVEQWRLTDRPWSRLIKSDIGRLRSGRMVMTSCRSLAALG